MKGSNMAQMQLKEMLLKGSKKHDPHTIIYGSNGQTISIYKLSMMMLGDTLFFIGRHKSGKYLYIARRTDNSKDKITFNGENVSPDVFGNGIHAEQCPLDHRNAEKIRELFPFTRPVVVGTADSFGFGDRLGIANPAHIQSLAGSHMRPVLAQQSVRELERTQRTAEEVLDAATWAVLQEGYTKGFGADADHLKTTEDIDRYAKVGFTMYTFDPSVHVVNEAVSLPIGDVVQRAKQLDTGGLKLDDVNSRYVSKTIRLNADVALTPDAEAVARAFLKYGAVIEHARKMYRHLTDRYASLPSEVELSVDETDIPTTPFEHYFVANELKRMGVKIVSLAPRFIGDFEKGVDYKGNLSAFEAEYKQHAAISQIVGPYKISIHSGSDKFSVYKVIGSLHQGNVHVKTAGTSYLEALRTIAKVNPPLLREMLDYSREQYEDQRKSYHVTAQINRVPAGKDCSDEKLLSLFEDHDARQVFHVTFGKVLTERNEEGKFLFRERFMNCLIENEELHYQTLIRHFKKHLDPFSRH